MAHVFQQRAGKIILGFLRPVAVRDRPHANHRVIQSHRVVGLEDFQRLFLSSQHQVALGHCHVNRQLADFRIGVLLCQQQRPLVKFQCPRRQGFVALLQPENLHHHRRLIDDGKAVRIAHHRPFRFIHAAQILGVAQIHQPRKRRVAPIILDGVANERIHRRIEKIRQLNQHRQFRQGQPRFPLINRTRRHAKRLGQLFLRQAARLAQTADMFAQCKCHAFSSLRLTAL